MCGITGFLNYNGEPVDTEVLRQMADAIRHRGPDGDGFYTHGGLGFGHRRLAIIDLSHEGDQPMVTADGRYALIFNGEIYNFRELRSELQNVSHLVMPYVPISIETPCPNSLVYRAKGAMYGNERSQPV
jgi:asparagine synthase (glutamine-hydrolysing)